MHHLETADGSFTYRSPIFKETFHSRYGALSESQHVFINAGLRAIAKETVVRPIQIFEMGLGSGLNALLTAQYASEFATPIFFHSVEAYPIPIEDIDGFKVDNLFDSPSLLPQFQLIHQGEWAKPIKINTYFSFLKDQVDFVKWSAPRQRYHCIYYDAFAPRAQSELWTETVMAKLYEMLKPKGILVTYCAQGQFKRNLKSVGFTVEALPGPKGKREMTRARKA
jgi:tRNA U34 5-methylaminomethyl-2-thiouridine-forming methyltransferase MnmC